VLSAAIIIFREVFEIVLILGIVLTATRGLPGRGKWIASGFLAGIGGSALVAMLTDRISQAAEGLGQELLNAGILFVAASFIGWTVLWIKKHAREMKAHILHTGAKIAANEMPFYSLSIIIALAILREGSEIALFTYGMYATGQTLLNLAAGALLGTAGGIVIGLLIYFGLVQLSVKHFLRVTSWLLVLLVAGMMSQGVGYLTAAGYADSLATVMWDSSYILSDSGFLGQSLKVLIGYTSQPTEAQVIMYILSISVLCISMRIIDRQNHPHPAGA